MHRREKLEEKRAGLSNKLEIIRFTTIIKVILTYPFP